MPLKNSESLKIEYFKSHKIQETKVYYMIYKSNYGL